MSLVVAHVSAADTPQWIWSPAQERDVPVGDCWFRKSFDVALPESGEIQITADDAYEVFVNGRAVGNGAKWQQLDTIDVGKYLVNGKNTVAVKVSNTASPDAGLVGRVIVKGQGGTFVAHVTDGTWKTSLKEAPQWTKPAFDDRQWLAARQIGPFGTTKPWFDEVVLAGGGMASRFRTQKDFEVEQILAGEQVGSIICLAFNEFGELLASREDGGLILVRDADGDGSPETPGVFCDKVRAVQGILPLNGKVLVIAAGPQGPGMYRLSDEDNDGKAEKVENVLKFKGEMGEHGPHAITLGPDGLVYIMLGNKTEPDRAADASSPYRNYYEADLFKPKYEDPRGHAAGIKAPGGRILRTDTEGSFLECYAGGLRNAYDMCFSRVGELFTYDSDMEWDIGTPWYRPTRVFQVLSGADFGWRSGWSVWPEYYYDAVPGTADTGRGSPTGMAAYDHVMYPRRYHDALFMGDWGRGRIVALKMKPDNGGYVIEGETFVEGKPLNVTDLCVGPDGWLYFCTGGRATDGGVYRVVWKGKVPPDMTNVGTGIQAALKQPQFDSAYARQKCAVIRQQMGEKWDAQLPAVVADPAAKLEHRIRALDLMQLMGPFPTPTLLTKLAADPHEQMRAKAAYFMGIHADQALAGRLVRLMKDLNPHVQRIACEALVRANLQPEAKEVLPLLASASPQVAWAATRLLETLPREQWQEAVLTHENAHVFLQGGLALVRVAPQKDVCKAILKRNLVLLNGYLDDADFLALLRLSELALAQGELTNDDAPGLRIKLADEYPTKDERMNRELVRLLAYLKEPRAADLFLEQLRGKGADDDKLHIALHARFLTDMTSAQKLELLTFFEYARTLEGGHSFQGYIENVSRDFFAGLTDQERTYVLSEGTKWPSSALSVLAKLPPKLTDETREQIIALDRRLPGAV
ncbi:MAG: heme-binding protein [Pirellulales bacterium]